MSHSHHHGHAAPTSTALTRRGRRAEERMRARVTWLLAAVLAPVLLALAAGAVVLWPSSETGGLSLEAATGDAPGTRYLTGVVTRVATFDCQETGRPAGAEVRCAHLSVRIGSGPESGQQVRVDVGPSVVRTGVQAGNKIRVARFPA